MRQLWVEDLLYATSGRLIIGDRSILVGAISTDSRSIKPQEVFLALVGKNFDGHDFIEDALRKGVQGLIISDDSKIHHPLHTRFVIKVEDTLEALGRIAAYYKERFHVETIAITGSNGKTTLKEMAAKILSQVFKVLASPKSFNNAIGVPLTLLRLEPHHEILILEMATSHLGEIGILTSIARPNIGVITNIGDSHLEYLGNREGVARAKFELFEKMEDGVAILNQDDPYLVSLGKGLRMKRITFGIKEEADVMAKDIQDLGFDGIRFNLNVKMEYGGETIEVRLPVLGEHNVYNALACGAIIKALDLEMDLLPKGLHDFRPPPSRMQLLEMNGIKIIDDTYNANPNSVFAALETLARLPKRGRKICIIGDMLELGQAARLFHMKLGERLARIDVDLLFTLGEFTRLTAKESVRAGIDRKKVIILNDHEEALKKIRPLLKDGDLILIKGSRKMQMERIIEGLMKKEDF